MKKNIGVCLGILAMGLGIVGVPAARAQSRLAASGTGGATETNPTTAAVVPAASSPVDLDRRVEELEKELVELRSEMAARKQAEETAAATPAPAATAIPQDKPAEKSTIASLLGPTSLSGFIDAYYQVNFNHPASRNVNFRAFDGNSKTLALNMMELVLDKAPDPMGGAAGRTGYHVALGYGQAMNIINASEDASSATTGLGGDFDTVNQAPGFGQYLKEAYFSYLAPIGKGLQVDVGKFVTPMGAEVIESKDNWNYSRGLLFSYAIPFFHFGARAKYIFNDKYSMTGFLVNGWNNTLDNNSGKTYGVSFALTPTKKLTITPTYLAGPEAPTGVFGPNATGGLVNVNDAWRQTLDVVVAYNPTAKLSFLLNGDYGRGDRTVTNFESSPFILSPPVWWAGGAGYVKYAIDANDYVAGRYEYFEDHDGFTTGVPNRTHFHEFTATYQRTLATHLLTRLEYRRDMTNLTSPVYEISTFGLPVNHQDTVSLGLIFLFDSRDAK